jgi:hypothetical protein
MDSPITLLTLLFKFKSSLYRLLNIITRFCPQKIKIAFTELIEYLQQEKITSTMYNYRQHNIRCASIILISAGYGWAGGHYIPVNSSILAYAFQFIIIGILLILGIRFLSLTENEKHKRNWSVKGLSIFSALSLLINILNIVHGAYNSDIHSFGSHNSFADLVPIVLIIIGTGLWLSTILGAKRTV